MQTLTTCCVLKAIQPVAIATEAFIRVCSLVCAYVQINLIVAVTKKCASFIVICFNFSNTKYEVAAKIQREIVEVNRE